LCSAECALERSASWCRADRRPRPAPCRWRGGIAPPILADRGLRAAIAARSQLPSAPMLVLSQYVAASYAADLLADGSGGADPAGLVLPAGNGREGGMRSYRRIMIAKSPQARR